MVTFVQLRDAKPALWQKSADGWLAESRHAEACANGIRAKGTGPLDDHWQDHVGQVARAALADLANKFESASDEMRGAAEILVAATESIATAQGYLHGIINNAGDFGIVVAQDGTLQPLPGRSPPAADFLSVERELNEALREATQADMKAAAALRRIQDSVGVTDPLKAVNEVQVAASHDEMAILAGDIPVGQGPLTVESWWNSLTPQQQQQKLLAEPIVIAGLDGIPDAVKKGLRGDGKYDRMKLVQFALDHWNDTGIDRFDNNCTNFVSTAMAAAGVQEKNDGWGTFGDDNWVQGGQTGWKFLDAHDFSNSASWARADKLHSFLTGNGSSEVPLNQVKPGDVIFFEQDSPNPDIQQGLVHHAAIVTAVAPDGDIKYTQHTDDRQNLSLNGRELHESTVEGLQKIRAVRISPNWY